MHFLKESEIYSRQLARPRAGVKVEVQGKDTLVLCAPENDEDHVIFILKPDARLSRLPDRVKVVDPEGKVVKPSKGKAFYVTLETFDPFHGVTEAGDEDL